MRVNILEGIFRFLEQLVTIELFGQPFTFKTQSESSRVKEIADYLAREVARVENHQSRSTSSNNQVAIMISTALNLAQENLELKSERAKLIHAVAKRSDLLIRKLDHFTARFDQDTSYKLLSSG